MCNPIDKIKTGKASNHDGLVAYHFIYVKYILPPLLMHMFNMAICEGLLVV